jgi:hypothetical protein
MLIGRAQNLFEHAVHILHHVAIPKSKHEITHRLEDSRSVRITFGVMGVLTAIKLHDQLGVGAEEVDDKTLDRHLPLEFPSVQSPIA